jgi:hypothetical protein
LYCKQTTWNAEFGLFPYYLDQPPEICNGIQGKVVKALPNAMFEVEIENWQIVLCTISGKNNLYMTYSIKV